MAPRHRQLSSTPLEILLFLNGWYYATYFLLEIFIFVYKGLLLPYPSANLALDLVMLFLYLGIEVTRIFFGSKGNLCQRKVPLAVSLALTFPAAVMAAYYLLLQTYALRLEAILNAILLFFYAVELLLGILTLASFSRLVAANIFVSTRTRFALLIWFSSILVWIHIENLCGLHYVKHFVIKGSCMKPCPGLAQDEVGKQVFLGKMKENIVPVLASNHNEELS